MTMQRSVTSLPVQAPALQDVSHFHERTDFDYVGFRPSGLIRLMVTRSCEQMLRELPAGCHMEGYLVAMRGGLFECGLRVETPQGEFHQRAYGNRVSKLLSSVQSRIRTEVNRRRPAAAPELTAGTSPLH